jgi:hypothetical protein
MTPTSRFLSLSRFTTVTALTLAFAVISSQSGAAQRGPFRNFVGEWSGNGQIVASNGHQEAIRCRAQGSDEKDGAALNQAIVCASESFKLDIKTHAEASGESVQGYWNEASRNVSGLLTGRIGENKFEGRIEAPSFNAAISLTSNGRAQEVGIRPSTGDIASINIDLRRRS